MINLKCKSSGLFSPALREHRQVITKARLCASGASLLLWRGKLQSQASLSCTLPSSCTAADAASPHLRVRRAADDGEHAACNSLKV